MESLHPWAKALEISESRLQEWQKDVKPNESLLYKLLIEKKIDEEKYLSWARNQYQLASVECSFFSSHLDAELWNSTRMDFQWTPDFLPIKIWEETLFIGCVEPPQTLPNFQRPVKLILAPASGLNQLWKFNLSIMGVEVTVTQVKEDEKKGEEKQVLSDISFAGLSLDKTAMDEANAAVTSSGSNTGSNTGSITGSTTGSITGSITTSIKPSFTSSKKTTVASSAPQKPPSPPTPTVKKVAPHPPPPPPFDQASTSDGVKLDPPKTMNFNTGKGVNLHAAPVNTDLIKNLDDFAAYAFKEMRSTFEKSMVLVYDDFKLKVHRWTENWIPDPKFKTTPISIDVPNIFKIAHDSKRPFHGSVSMNPSNKLFFDHWNAGQLPRHITIYPVLAGTHLFGYILGITNQEIHLMNSLDFMTKLVSSLNKTVGKLAA